MCPPEQNSINLKFEAPCSSEAETYYPMRYNHPEDYNFCDLISEGIKHNI